MCGTRPHLDRDKKVILIHNDGSKAVYGPDSHMNKPTASGSHVRRDKGCTLSWSSTRRAPVLVVPSVAPVFSPSLGLTSQVQFSTLRCLLSVWR
jgi:hypothetical protein